MKTKWNKTVKKKKIRMSINLMDSKMRIRMRGAIQIEFKIHKNFSRICKKLRRKFRNSDIFQISLNVHMSTNKLFL
jgi:hypothetical protein